MQAFNQAYKDRVSFFNFGRGNGYHTWENGIALRLHTIKTPATIHTDLGRALEAFDSWAIHDGESRCVGYGGRLGPTATFFDEVNESGDPDCRVQQLFILHEGDDRKKQQIFDRLTRHYQRVLCKPVFHFEDGRIYLIHTKEPESITQQRMQGYPMLLLRGFAICESDGEIVGVGSWRSLGSIGRAGND